MTCYILHSKRKNNRENQRYNKVLAVITLYQALGGGRE